MTVKQKALKLIKERKCTYEINWHPYGGFIRDIDVCAPEGYLFDGELTSLVCKDWKDVLDRLPYYNLEKEEILNEN